MPAGPEELGDQGRPARGVAAVGEGSQRRVALELEADPRVGQALAHQRVVDLAVAPRLLDDGVEFDLDALRVDEIREELEYGGLRLRTTASIRGARIAVTVDVGFGDALEPGAEVIDYPSMLDLPTPRLRAYARETVIAEKFQAMVALGRANSRMKDFYDIWLLSQSFPFDDDRLAPAIAATFERRETEIPAKLPDALTPAFAEDEQKQRQWNAFLENVALRPGSLADVIASIARFIMPHAVAAVKS